MFDSCAIQASRLVQKLLHQRCHPNKVNKFQKINLKEKLGQAGSDCADTFHL